MKKNDLLINNNSLIRLLNIVDDKILVIDCIKCTMPKIVNSNDLNNYTVCENNVFDAINILNKNNNITSKYKSNIDISELSPKDRKIAHNRYSMIVPILPHIALKSKRSEMINIMANINNISTQSIKHYLCKYLVYQNISVLAPETSFNENKLSVDEKNMRWALNKYFYTTKKNSLNTAYVYLLKEKYCDNKGNLLSEYPSFYQFRYFYRKHKKLQNYYISRNGLKDYQKNKRPLLGENIQEYAKNIGMGMLDATICDIYLIDDAGNIVGRPILTACIDAYSSMCMGYSLTWEGGIYSLKNLMQNIISDKQELCNKFGIHINNDIWNCNKLPGVFVTDRGTEYVSENFEQISELGITIVNLPSYRPELKGAVEKFFDLIQNSFKPYLKGKGIIEPDFQERGAHDYRKDACLTMMDFEKVILKCIIHYNTKRILNNFPYSQDMLNQNIKPFANCIWNYNLNSIGTNLIDVSKELLTFTLYPRTKGVFSRYGLKVNKLRYKNNDYTEKYLKKEECTVAYNPNDTSTVWYIENGNYIPFTLIEKQYEGKKLDEIYAMQLNQKEIIASVEHETIQAKIDLAKSIELIADKKITNDTNIKNIIKNKQKAKIINHNENI